jgi:hypothetical protein
LQAGEKSFALAMDARSCPPGCFLIASNILSPFIPGRVPFVIFYRRLSGAGDYYPGSRKLCPTNLLTV